MPFANQTTNLKTNQIRTSQPVQFNYMNHHSSTLQSNAKLMKHKKNRQLDKLRTPMNVENHSNIMAPTSTSSNDDELMERQNLNNSIIEDRLLNSSTSSLIKSNDNSVCRLFINNQGVHTNRSIVNPDNSNFGDSNNFYQNIGQNIVQNKFQTSQNLHSQSVDNLKKERDNKTMISNRLLELYNNNLTNHQVNKDKIRQYNSNLSLRTSKYQRCVVNIPTSIPVFKSSLANLNNNQLDNFNNDDEDDLRSPPPPAPPARKISLPVELRNDAFTSSYQKNQQYLNESSNEFKDQKKCLSFNHSTPSINLTQFKYNLYLNKLKEDEYQKQLEQNKLEQEQMMSQVSIDESLTKSLVASTSSIESINDQDLINSNLNCDLNNDQDDQNLRPSTSASTTTRIMINFRKSNNQGIIGHFNRIIWVN